MVQHVNVLLLLLLCIQLHLKKYFCLPVVTQLLVETEKKASLQQNIYDRRQIAFSFSATARKNDVKEICSHVDFKSIKR